MINHHRDNEFRAHHSLGHAPAVGGEDPDFVLKPTRTSLLCRIPLLHRFLLRCRTL